MYEVAGSDSHVDYDKAQYTVTVEVRYDKDTLTVSQPEIQKDGKAVESIDFVNTYTPIRPDYPAGHQDPDWPRPAGG